MNNPTTVDICGAVTFWNCAKSTDQVQLEARLRDLGHEDLSPKSRTAFSAAKRAAQLHYGGSKFHIGNLKDGLGVAIERVSHEDEHTNRYPQIAYMVVDEDTRTLKEVRCTDVSIDYDHRVRIEDMLRTEFSKQLDLCGASAVGIALTKACEKLGAKRVRKNGGVYFIPAFSQDQFRDIAQAFEDCANDGNTFVESLTVAKTDETVRGVHNSLREQTRERIEEIKSELNSNLGKRGRKNRSEEVRKLLDSTAAYETLLDQSLADVREDLEALKAQLAKETFSAASAMFAAASQQPEGSSPA